MLSSISLDQILNAFVTLFVTLDPIGVAPIFLVLTKEMTVEQRLSTAKRACLVSTGILLLFAIFGMAILSLFGITLPAFRIAGGLLLFWTAFEMIYERRQDHDKKLSQDVLVDTRPHDLALFPLAIPLLAGPGTMSATVILSQQFKDAPSRALLIAIILILIGLTYTFMRLADLIDNYLSDGARVVMSRLFGVILAALSIQVIADGIRALMKL